MTEYSRRPGLAGVGMASRHLFQCKAIGRSSWLEMAAMVRARASWSAAAEQAVHPIHRGRPDFLFENAATEREMRRL